MKKRLTIFTAMVLALFLLIPLAGCGQSGESYDGKLTVVELDTIAVEGDSGAMEFETTAETEYDLGDQQHLVIGDEVTIDYHSEGGRNIADKVKVTKHKEIPLSLKGKVVDINEFETVTVSTDTLTVEFLYDKETAVKGNLSKDDEVEVEYKGDLSTDPYAETITVLEDARAETLNKTVGTVSEVSSDSFLLSGDSASAYRIMINEDTIIAGPDGKIKVGDRATVAYTGDLDDKPMARRVDISRDSEQQFYVLDGVIQKMGDTSMSVVTSKGQYNFKLLKRTIYNDKELAVKGNYVTVTYMGDLNGTPTALSIFCKKWTKKDEKKHKSETTATRATTKSTTKATTKATTKETTKATKKTDPTETKKPTQTETKKPTQTETKKPTQTETKKPTETKTEPTETKTEPTETKTEPTETKTEPTETQTDPTETQTEPTETQTEPTETQTEPTETDPPTETEPTDPPDVMVTATGTIVSVGGTFRFKTSSGELSLDMSDVSISGGYIPQEGDQVKIVYEKNSMKCMELQLLNRPEQPTEPSGSGDGGSGE